MKLFFKTFIISACCIVVFVGVGYYYINQNLSRADSETVEKVPYYQEKPENSGILLDVSGDKTFLYFDFENNRILTSLFLEDSDISENEIYGYPIEFAVNTDIDFVIDLVDYLEGIELTMDNETLRYTGVQVADIILNDKEKANKKEITKALVNQISKNGIGNDMLLEIVENSETNITVPDFYYWPEYLGESASNLQIIDG